jgi:NADH:ubiquinone oxidoreductase subunit B-like Fe-S oxidoreductase
MFLTWKTRTNTTSTRRSRWRRSVDLWKQSYVAACAAMYGKLRRSRRLDAVQSGCTALSIVKQGDLMVVVNADDSRVVLGTATDDDAITPSSSSST